MLTDLCRSLHLEHLDTLDKGGARVVNAVEHGLGTGYQRLVETDEWKQSTYLELNHVCKRSFKSVGVTFMHHSGRD